MTLETLLLLQRCLYAQQMNVGDPSFRDTAKSVLKAMEELDEAIAEMSMGPTDEVTT